jgi:hypothetical protein
VSCSRRSLTWRPGNRVPTEELKVPMAHGKIDLKVVIITIGHPFGDLEVPLTEWMARGPGVRPLLPSAGLAG